MYRYYNPNPASKKTGDCVVRALSKALDISWEDTYWKLCATGSISYDMPNSNYIWGKLLLQNGFKKSTVPDDCPECYTIEDFAREHQHGVFVIGTGSHAVTIVDGVIYDAWDSGEEQPVYYYSKGDTLE